MIPRYRISWRGTVLVFGAFFLLGFAAGLSSSLACLSSSFECFVASKYVIFLFCFVFSFVLSLCGLSVVLVEESMDISSLPGSLATFPGSGVIAAVASLFDRRFVVGVGVSTVFLVLVVGANDSFVCCGPGELISLSLCTRVCLVLRPPLGEASFPAVLVGLRFPFGFLVMVAHVASGTLEDVAARAGQLRLCRSS